MSNVKKVIICILAIALVVLAAKTNVFATEDIFNVFTTGNENGTPEQIQDRNQNVENGNSNKDTNSNLNTNSNTNKNTNKNVNNNANTANASEHADAGVDYSIVFIIAICGVSAVYAYRKIRQYNV